MGFCWFVDFPSVCRFPECFWHSGNRPNVSRVSTLEKATKYFPSVDTREIDQKFPECRHSGKLDPWQFPGGFVGSFPECCFRHALGKYGQVSIFPGFVGQTVGTFPSVFSAYYRVSTLGKDSRYGWRSRSAGFSPECRSFPSVYIYTRERNSSRV